MREIKFRGKSLNTGNWVYGDLFQRGKKAFVEYEVNPDTVGQFTGLYDANGKEIYEGDLIKAPSGWTYTIIFGKWVHNEKRKFPKVIDRYEHTGWCISLNGKTPCDLLDSEVCQGIVVGNIHDNHELQKGGNYERDTEEKD